MGYRHRRSRAATRDVNLGIELLGQRVYYAGAEATFCLRKDANWRADPIIDNRKLPIRSSGGESDSYLPIDSVVGEGVLECVQNEFCDDQAEAYGLTRADSTCIAGHFQCVGR